MKKILLSLSLVIVSLFAVSQVDVRSSLKGSVTDSSGPVSGADVVVVFTPTGSTDRAVTNAAGAFVVNNLAPVLVHIFETGLCYSFWLAPVHLPA